MFSKSIQIVKNSIFPIFHFGPKNFGVLGTGFFIDNEGHFITASHVINAMPKNSKLGYLGNIPNRTFNGESFNHINVVQQDDAKDLAIAKVQRGALPSLKFAEKNAEIGESIALCGYPLPLIAKKQTANPNTKSMNIALDVTAVRQYWQPTIKIDAIKKNFLYNKQFNSFISQHPALPGMSGGPIFNLEGEVVGVTSANWTRTIKKDPLSLNVDNGIGIDLGEVKSFIHKALHAPKATVNVATNINIT